MVNDLTTRILVLYEKLKPLHFRPSTQTKRILTKNTTRADENDTVNTDHDLILRVSDVLQGAEGRG